MQDEDYMRMALNLARKGLGKTLPNPMVGAVVVKNKKIVGRGYHKRYGESHAEINALMKAGKNASGATLYVNLEPCCFYGNTPPCTEAIMKAGIKKVVCAAYDPNPKVKGRGIKKLMEGKIEVEVGVLEKEAKRLNEIYFKFRKKKLPFVILFLNLSLDGKMVPSEPFYDDSDFQKFLKRLYLEVNGILVNSMQSEYLFNLLRKEKYRLFVFDKKRDNTINTLHNLIENNIFCLLVTGGKEVNTYFLKNKLVDKIYSFFSPDILGKGENPFGDLGIFEVSDCVCLEEVKLQEYNSGFLLSGYPLWRR